MRAIFSIIAGVAAFGLASGVEAQQKKAEPKTAAPKSETCITTDGKTECSYWRTSFDSAFTRRAAIGVQLSPTGTSRDTLGVFISRVTPRGPADNAGIVEGDRIVSINGIDLRVNAADAGDSYAAGLPSRRLTREVAKLSPGAVVNLRVWSGGRIRDVTVTTGRASDLSEGGGGGFYGLFGADGPGGMVYRNMPMASMKVPVEQMRSMESMRSMENMKRPLEQMRVPMERRRMEGLPRMRFEDFDGIGGLRIEALPGLKDGQSRLRIYSPQFRDGEYRTYIIGPDGELKLDKTGGAKKAEAEEKAGKEKSSKK